MIDHVKLKRAMLIEELLGHLQVELRLVVVAKESALDCEVGCSSLLSDRHSEGLDRGNARLRENCRGWAQSRDSEALEVGEGPAALIDT